MQPTHITIKNFKSIKSIELDLTQFKDKTVLILAKNEDSQGSDSNFSGKSNLMRAFMWCLFGVSTIEGTSDEITTYGEKETSVIIKFDTGAEIERRFKSKAQTFFYRVNGKDESDSNKDAESLFLRDIGLESKNKAIISNSIYLNSEVDNLINSTVGDRLKTLTEWFDLSHYDKAVETARNHLKEWQTDLTRMETELEQAHSSQSNLERYTTDLVRIEQEIRDLKDKEIKLRDRQKDFDSLENVSGKLFLLKEKLDETHRLNDDTINAKGAIKSVDIKQLEDKKEELVKARNDYAIRKSEIKERLSDLRSQLVKPLTCPHCSSALILSQSELIEVSIEANERVKEEITKLENSFEEAPESPDATELKIREYYRFKPFAERELVDTKELENEIESLKSKVESKPKDYSFELKELSQKLMDLSSDKGEIQSNLSFINEQIEKIPSLEQESNKLNELCRLARLWAGERSKVGIFQELKALTFSKIITNLQIAVNNILMNHFMIPTQIKIESNSKGIELCQVLAGEQHPVLSMSSGERARVAFALALALKQFYSTKLDVIFADEFFSHLDSTGMEFVINTMNTFKGMKFLISHTPVENDYQINLVKRKGTTYVG